MGRRPDSPEEQAAKGYPGKRRKKIDRLIADSQARAIQLAPMIERSDDVLTPIGLLADPLFADARWIWDHYAPRLRDLNLFNESDRLTFGMYCVYQAEFFQAARAVATEGYSVLVKTVSLDRMPRRNPNVDRRDNAFKNALDLAVKFGLTPLDLGGLEKLYSGVRDMGPLFRRRQQDDQPAPETAPSAPAEPDAIGLLDSLDSPPPGVLPN